MVYGRYAMVRGKCKMKNLKDRLSKKILLILASGLIVCGPKVQALPSQGTLDNSASATITTDMANNTMNIAGKGQNNIIDWASFNIDKGERVNFADKNNYLNLVHGVDMSRIYGTISGGNAVYLVNPNGILFADGAALDNVGSFVASTRNISSINKEAFLDNPSNTTAVLGVDNPVMDNKDYYTEDSKYVPKITMADLKLTNVPESATIILDGPGGVILKSKDLLNDKITHVITRQIGGELGFGYEGGIADLSLTDAEKEKVSLVNGDKYYGKDSAIPYPVRSYKWIRNWDELKAYSNINVNKMLVNDINLTGYTNPIEKDNGILEGLGYSINGLKQDSLMNTSKDGSVGLYKIFLDGAIRNININDVDLSYKSSDNFEGAGAVASFLGKSLLSNVNVSGVLKAQNSHKGTVIGGLTGNSYSSEIRNCTGNVEISVSNSWNKEFNQGEDDYYYTSSTNMVGGLVGATTNNVDFYNNINKGNITYTQNTVSMYNTFGLNNIGGILGSAWGALKILGNENLGDINITPQNPRNGYNIGFYNIGGIVGGSNYYNEANKLIGDTYNFGKITVGYQPSAYTSSYRIGMYVGGINGSQDGTDKNITSDITKKALGNYYVKNFIPTGSGINVSKFGEGRTWNDPNPSNIQDDLIHHLHEMVGLHDFSTTHEVPKPPTQENPNEGNTGSGTTNQPSGSDTGSGTTNPPSGGNTGSGTTNLPSGGNTGDGTTNPPSINDAKIPTIGELLMQQLKNMENGFRDKELDDLLAAMLNGVSARGILEEYNSIVDPRELQKLINNIDSKIDYEEKHADEIRVENLYNSLTSEIENELYNICNTENKKNKEEEFNNLLKVINLDGIPETDKSKILKTVGGMLKEAFDESVSSSKKSIPTDQKGMVEYAYNLISSNIKLDEEVVTGTNGTYSISYNRAMGAIEIKGTGNENSSISLVGNSGATEALANYTVALAELNTEVWTDVVSQCVDAAGKVVPGKVEKLASQIVLGLMMPEGEIKGQYIEKVNQNISNTVKRDVVNQARDIVSDYIPGGESIIAAADLISEAKGEYSKYMNMSLKEKEADKSYAAFQNVCDQAANLLGVLY